MFEHVRVVVYVYYYRTLIIVRMNCDCRGRSIARRRMHLWTSGITPRVCHKFAALHHCMEWHLWSVRKQNASELKAPKSID